MVVYVFFLPDKIEDEISTNRIRIFLLDRIEQNMMYFGNGCSESVPN